MPDADAAWRCPRGCDPCVHFDAALRKDIVDDMLHKYGFDFKEAPVPMIIDSAPIVFTARMMIDPAFPLCCWQRHCECVRLDCRTVREAKGRELSHKSR